MAKIFSIDPSIRQVVSDVMDDLLANTSQGGMGKTCRLVYPPKLTPCLNCIYDSVANRSSNRPVSGAPQPFPPGTLCPMCSGKGMNSQEQSEEITLKCNWEPRNFLKPSSVDIRLPYSVVEVKGYMSDLPKILKCDHLILNLPVEPYIRQKFRLMGEPGDPSNIVPGRYFVAFFERLA
jgi:hypothetical protein